MAKSKSFYGLRRGSTKSMTYSVLNGQQITKDRVVEVRNPKTAGQAVQRMKLAPAQKFYDAFSEVLNHSWQGVEFGNKSRQHFMSEAMKQNGGPYVIKGFPSLIPGTYPIANGSLAKVNITDFTEGETITTDLYVGSATLTTAADWIDAIITNNAGFEEGDKISLICVMYNARTGAYSPMKKQLILKDTLAADESDDRAELLATFGNSTDHYLQFALDEQAFLFNNSGVCAMGIIHSRGEGSSAKRSEARMSIGETEYGKFYSQAAYEVALQSYQSDGGVPVSDDWYLNSFAAGKIGRVVNKSVTFTNDGHQYTVNYLALVIDVAGVQKEYVFTQAGDVLVDNEGFAVSVNDGALDVTTAIAGLTGATTMAWDSSYLQLYSGF